jgi:hypothetical protein
MLSINKDIAITIINITTVIFLKFKKALNENGYITINGWFYSAGVVTEILEKVN